MTNNTFEKRIKPILLYIGSIGAVITSIAYILTVCVLVFGFKVRYNNKDMFLCAAVNAVFGFIVTIFLQYQGIAFAKNNNAELVIQYSNRQTRERKPKSLLYYWVTSIISTIFTKVLSIFISTCCIVYIVIKGFNDYTLLLLAFVNILMFVCFGLLALNGAYNYYCEEYVPYMKNKLLQRDNVKGDNNDTSR